MKASLSDFDRRYGFLVAEHEKLQNDNRSKQHEIEELKQKYFELEMMRLRDLEEFKQQFESYQRSNIVIIIFFIN